MPSSSNFQIASAYNLHQEVTRVRAEPSTWKYGCNCKMSECPNGSRGVSLRCYQNLLLIFLKMLFTKKCYLVNFFVEFLVTYPK